MTNKVKPTPFNNLIKITTILSFVLFISCNSDDSEPENQYNFTGTITNETNEAMENVTISLGENTTKTNADGVFVLEDLTLKENKAYITAKKEGYLKGMRTVINLKKNNEIKLALLEDKFKTIFLTGAESIISIPNALNAFFHPYFQEEEGGKDYSGFMYPVIYDISPFHTNVKEIMPGVYEEIENVYVIMHFKIRGTDNQIINVKNGYPAKIQFQIKDEQLADSPSKIALLNFNEEEGNWVNYGEAVKDETVYGWVYKIEISSFSNPWFKVENW